MFPVTSAFLWQKSISLCPVSSCTPRPNFPVTPGMGIPDHLTSRLRNMYAVQETTVRNGHGTTDWFQIGKGVHQGSLLSPCSFNLYVFRSAGKDWGQEEKGTTEDEMAGWHH